MRTTLLFLFTLLIGNSFAQTQAQLDSLERLIPKKKGKERIQLLNDLTYYYCQSNPQKAISFGARSLKEAKDLNDPKILAGTYNDYSMPFLTTGDFQKSVELNTKALEIRMKLHDTVGMMSSYAKLGTGYYELTQYKKSQEAYNKAIVIAKSMGDENTLAQLYLNSANVMELSGYIEEALKLQLDVNKIAVRTQNKPLLLTNYGNIASCYRKLKQFDKAREAYKKVIELAKETGQTEQLSLVYQGLGVLERDAGNTDLGLSYYKKAFALYSHLDSETGEGIVAINIGNCFMDLNNLDSAAYYLNYGLKLVKDTKSYRQIQNAYKSLSQLELKRKNYQKASEYLQLQNNYQDSVSIFQGNEVLTDMFGKYELEKHEKELLESEAENTRNQLYQAIWIGVSVTLLLFLLVIFLFFRHKRKIAREELIRTKQEEHYLREKQLNEQKMSISRELHDNIGSQITYLISSIDNMSYVDEDNLILNNQLRDLSDFGRNTMQELRSTIWAMNAEDGTIALLLTRIESLRSKIPLKLEITNDLPKNYPLKSTELLNIFRIIQEALQNTLKYAHAQSISIRFNKTADGFQLEISDDGKGMEDAAGSSSSEGNGLRNMRYRCEQLGGAFELDSKPGKGTTIRCKLSHIAY